MRSTPGGATNGLLLSAPPTRRGRELDGFSRDALSLAVTTGPAIAP